MAPTILLAIPRGFSGVDRDAWCHSSVEALIRYMTVIASAAKQSSELIKRAFLDCPKGLQSTWAEAHVDSYATSLRSSQ